MYIYQHITQDTVQKKGGMAAPDPFWSKSWLFSHHTIVSFDVPLGGIQWITALQCPLIVGRTEH